MAYRVSSPSKRKTETNLCGSLYSNFKTSFQSYTFYRPTRPIQSNVFLQGNTTCKSARAVCTWRVRNGERLFVNIVNNDLHKTVLFLDWLEQLWVFISRGGFEIFFRFFGTHTKSYSSIVFPVFKFVLKYNYIIIILI